ncbi:hypothetical protein [Streptomyces shaanxiensis]|uniref:Uncharacterized protein n=1 Tax=Streptomyces shaanxiensis TaxID=653357 RepID=A0ABP7UD69_9ACTN
MREGPQTQAADGPGVVVAHEADAIDPRTRLGWSIRPGLITGILLTAADSSGGA